MSDSQALGFWAKHCWAMELFCGEETLPAELEKLREKERESSLIDEVIDAGERDAQLILSGIQSDIEGEICRNGSPFKVVKKRIADAWEISFHLQPRRGSKDQFKAEIGARFYESNDGLLKLAVWIWAAGGRSREQMFTRILSKTREGASVGGGVWANGVALFFDEPLSNLEFQGRDGISVDMLKLRQCIRETLVMQSNERLLRLVQALKL